MAQLGTCEHKRRVAVRKAAHHTGAAANLSIQSFKENGDADTSPCSEGKRVSSILYQNVLKKLEKAIVNYPNVNFMWFTFGVNLYRLIPKDGDLVVSKCEG